MREAATKLANGGTIINLSSSTARVMMPAYSTYSATKAAVEQLTRVFSKEVGRGINVNAIAPGPTNTDEVRKRRHGIMTNKAQDGANKVLSYIRPYLL